MGRMLVWGCGGVDAGYYSTALSRSSSGFKCPQLASIRQIKPHLRSAVKTPKQRKAVDFQFMSIAWHSNGKGSSIGTWAREF